MSSLYNNIDNIILSLLTILTILAASLAICARTLLYSVFSLILVFAAGIWFFVYVGAEYIMVLFLIIYMGAILVFFLFVLMLLDKKYWLLRSGGETFNVSLIATKLAFMFFAIITISTINLIVAQFNFGDVNYVTIITSDSLLQPTTLTNIELIGLVLYTEYSLVLVIGGLVLLNAIIGCVLLIKPYRVKRDNY
jgi:NADH-quinone oxidoreductase subunit J